MNPARIISADDFGMRVYGSERILLLAERGRIQRVSILINYAARYPDLMDRLARSGIKLDLHFESIRTLGGSEKIDEKPISRGIRFLDRLMRSGIPHDAVRAEWRTQMERFRKIVGRVPDGVNSHEHVHFFPPFFKIFAGLAETYRIPYIRFSSMGMRSPKFRLTPAVLAACWRIDRRIHKKNGIPTSDFLVSMDWLRDASAFFKTLPQKNTTEFVVHPERDEEYRWLSAEGYPHGSAG